MPVRAHVEVHEAYFFESLAEIKVSSFVCRVCDIKAELLQQSLLRNAALVTEGKTDPRIEVHGVQRLLPKNTAHLTNYRLFF